MANVSGKITIPAPPSGCLTSITELLAHIQANASITLALPNGTFVSYGTTEPGEEFRTSPWIKTDSGGGPLGTFIFSTKLGAWVRDTGAVLGERRSVFRTEETMALDLAAKGLDVGWEVCDGTGTTALDFRCKDKDIDVTIAIGGGSGEQTISVPQVRGFFQPETPNLPTTTEWTFYTVVFIGY